MKISLKITIQTTLIILTSILFIFFYFQLNLNQNTGDFLRYALLPLGGVKAPTLDTNLFEFLNNSLKDPSFFGLSIIQLIVGDNPDYISRVVRLTFASYTIYFFYILTIYKKSSNYKFICTMAAISTPAIDLFFGQLRNAYSYTIVLIIFWLIKSNKFKILTKLILITPLTILSIAFHLSSLLYLPYLIFIFIFTSKIRNPSTFYILISLLYSFISSIGFYLVNDNIGRIGYADGSGLNFIIFALVIMLINIFFINKYHKEDFAVSFILSFTLLSLSIVTSQSARFIAILLPLILIYSSKCKSQIPSISFLLFSIIYSSYRILS